MSSGLGVPGYHTNLKVQPPNEVPELLQGRPTEDVTTSVYSWVPCWFAKGRCVPSCAQLQFCVMTLAHQWRQYPSTSALVRTLPGRAGGARGWAVCEGEVRDLGHICSTWGKSFGPERLVVWLIWSRLHALWPLQRRTSLTRTHWAEKDKIVLRMRTVFRADRKEGCWSNQTTRYPL